MRASLVKGIASLAEMVATAAIALIAVAPQGRAQAIPTLQSLSQAAQNVDYTAEQLRRFRKDPSSVVTVRERMEVDANGSGQPAFAVTFLGVEGELPGSPAHAEWQNTYDRFGPLFYTHGTFKVRDLAIASANYSLHDFGAVLRAGRLARRMVVFPSTTDKAIWVIDVDTQTSVPLFTAEFDSQLRLLSEVEVVAFSTGVAQLTPPAASALQPDFVTAKLVMGNPSELVDPVVSVASDYRLDTIEVQSDPLNGNQKLMMTYTDGIDQFVVVQTPGTKDLFSGLPSNTGGGHTIARYRDPAMSALLFWESGVSFHVAGRGALHRLDQVASQLYLQALSSH